ncbi:MAG: hypothetical protein M3Q69_03310 [Acidobacteriota bacterium]|nr:hypothetical protein [Acidobacteriota bacterium]
MTDGIEALRVSARWLGHAVAVSMVLMFAAVAAPWLMRMIEVDLAPLAWTLTAFALVHVALMLAADRVQSRAVMLRVLYAVPLFGAGFMAALWQFGGGVAHPTLALALVLPVMAAAALPRPRFAFDVAIYSIVAVTATVIIASADFAWYLTQLGLPAGALSSFASEEALAIEPFPGATTTPAAVFLMVMTFALLQLAAAFFCTRVARFVRERQELALRVEEHRADTLPAQALEATPAACVTLVAATGQIVNASKQFTQQMLLHNAPVIGRELPEVLAFADARALRTLIDDGGTIPHCRYRIGPEERTARVSVTRFEHDGTMYANVLIDDEREEAGSLAIALLLAMLCVPAARAQDAIVIGANVDRIAGGEGGGASVMWIHARNPCSPQGPSPGASRHPLPASGARVDARQVALLPALRGEGARGADEGPTCHADTFLAGATFLSLPGTRWGYATIGIVHPANARTTFTADANLGSGSDREGSFPYVLVRGGITRQLAQRAYAEAEWLQVNVARQQDGIARIGATFIAQPRLTLRASLFESIFGDNDVSLGTVRADYDLARVTLIGGFSAGRSVPALLQQSDDIGRVREAFGGVAFDAASQRWTLLVTSREDHQRLSVTCRVPLR